MNIQRKVGDICVSLTPNGKPVVVVLTEIDHTKFPSLDTYDIATTLTVYPGRSIRVDNLRVVMTSEELVKLLAEQTSFDFSTPPENPDSEISDADRIKRLEAQVKTLLAAK
jgi:hypothetical protein